MKTTFTGKKDAICFCVIIGAPLRYLCTHGVRRTYRVRAHTPFLQGLQPGLHPAGPAENPLSVVLRS